MKTIYAISAIMFMALLIGCTPNDNLVYNYDDEPLLYTEQAYPDNTGEIVQLTVNGTTITCEKINDEYIFQGDILLQPSTRGAVYAEGNLWPENTVYYTINTNLPNPERVTQAIDYYHTYTNLNFVERTNQANYIDFIYDANGCSSFLGMIGGKQLIRLADWGTKGTVIHEIGHAIGLLHEHSKAGRDQYINIVEENITSGTLHNFEEFTSSYPNTSGFDFGSIMLYSSYAFSKNNQPTIVKKNGKTFNAQRIRMSEDDLSIVNLLYPATDGYTLAQRTILEALSGTYECDDIPFGFIFSEKYDSPDQRLLDFAEQGQQTVTVHGKGQMSIIEYEYLGLFLEFYFQIQEDGESLIIYGKSNEEEGYIRMNFSLDDVSFSGFKIYSLEDDETEWITFTKVTNPYGLTEAQENVLDVLDGVFYVQGEEDSGSITFVPNDPPEVIEENVEEGILIKATSHGRIINADDDAIELNYYVWKNGEMISMFSELNDDFFSIEGYLEIISPTSFKLGFIDEDDDIVWATFIKEGSESDTFTDSRDGNVYKTVTIGEQTWMAENLAYLPSVVGPVKLSYTIPYYYVYGYDGANVSAAKATDNYSTYGVLYNWPAALTACPAGWHLPSDAEWAQLETFLANNGYNYDGTTGLAIVAAGCDKIAKSIATDSGWRDSDYAGAVGNTDRPEYRNKSGFSALPGGNRDDSGAFLFIGLFGTWWSSSSSTDYALNRHLQYDDSAIYRLNYGKDYGLSVRCVRD
jgi:uncharacterized protein (TIGR02145 family)